MEVLNNIWTAISTPNEGLVNVLMTLATFVEAILIMFLFTAILNINSSKKQKTICIFILIITSLITRYILPNPFYVFSNYLIMFLTIKFTFKLNILRSFLGVIISSLILALTGLLISNPYLTILNISSNEMSSIPIYRVGYLTLIYFILVIIIIGVKYKNINLNVIDDLDKKNKYIIIANLAFGLITLLIQAIITFYYTDRLPIIITFLSFLSLLAYFCISIYSFTRIMKLTLTTRKLQSAEEYNNTLRILHDNVRGFKHDFDNIVTTIGGFIRTNDMKGLKTDTMRVI